MARAKARSGRLPRVVRGTGSVQLTRQEFRERILERQRSPVRAVRRHRVQRVAGQDDPRADRDQPAAQAVRVAAAVPVLVLVAHDYKYDLPVLRHALSGEVGYVGMLGSRRRGDAILRMLREE